MSVKHIIWVFLSPHHASSTLLAVFLNHQVVQLRQITSGSTTTYPPIFEQWKLHCGWFSSQKFHFCWKKISSEATSPWVLSFLMAEKNSPKRKSMAPMAMDDCLPNRFQTHFKDPHTLGHQELNLRWVRETQRLLGCFWRTLEEMLRTTWENNQYWSSAIQPRSNLFLFLVGWVLFFLVTLRWNVDF